MDIDKECERIENDPNLSREEKDEQISELEAAARDAMRSQWWDGQGLDPHYPY